MPSSARGPTNAQISSKLGYSARTPAFLQKLKNQVAGISNEDEEPQYVRDGDDTFYDDGSGRPPIPVRRPDIPTRPDDDPGSADEEGGDELPTVVVLKEGKHLSAREVENERRKQRGLPPLPEKEEVVDDQTEVKKKAPAPSLSFSSGKAGDKSQKKRKLLIEDPVLGDLVKKKSKKVKKDDRKMLSFDAD